MPRPGLRDIVAWALGRRSRFTIAGSSMEPTLLDGDLVLVRPYATDAAQPGHIVLTRHPHRNMHIVKRVQHIDEGEHLFVIGDNPTQSTDSRHWGVLPPSALVGRIVARIRR